MGSKKRPLPKELSALDTTKGGGHGRRRLSVCTSHSSESSSSSSSPFDYLTDDLLTDILLRVPVKPLYRSKCVSKRWRSIISSTYFARSYSLTNHHNDMLLLEAVHPVRKEVVDRVYALRFLPGAYPHVSSIPITFDFIPPLSRDIYDIIDYDDEYTFRWKDTSKVLSGVLLVGAYGGLVLLSACFLGDNYYWFHHYYLCNPVSKQWVELPVISSHDIVGFTCYYSQQGRGQDGVSRIWADTDSYEDIIKNNADYDPNKIDFTVVSIKEDRRKDEFIASVFSSTDEAAEWSIFHVPCPPSPISFSMVCGNAKLVFLNGKFHWCGTNCIIAYDPFNKPLHCDIIPLPPMDPVESETKKILVLETCEGRLRLVHIFTYGRFRVWDLVDYANKAWVQKLDVFSYHLLFQSFAGVAARDKVYMSDYLSTVKLFDVRNKSLQTICDPNKLVGNVSELGFVTPFFSSPWPTPVAVQQNKLLSYINFDEFS